MDIKLYNTISRSNVVDKVLTPIATYSNSKFLEPYDEYSPVIKVRGKTNYDNANYLVVTESGNDGFTRAYFIDRIEYKSPQISYVYCRMDVLMTFKDYIRGMKCYLQRSESNGNLYLPDNRQTLVYNNIEKKTFKDLNDNVQGFVVPNEGEPDQKNNGFYVLSVLTAGYSTT